MKRIGITGPTGAGKTTALRVLERRDVAVIDADQVYHGLLDTSAPLLDALQARFGADILDKMGKLDRKRLGRMVFGNPSALADLNAITHRFILEEVGRLAGKAGEQGRRAVAVDAIALVESGLAEDCDVVVGVLASKQTRIRRIMAREGISEDYARARVEAQQGDAFFQEHCDFLLWNDADDPECFAQQAEALFAQIMV